MTSGFQGEMLPWNPLCVCNVPGRKAAPGGFCQRPVVACDTSGR
jgi:hypothetical protein